MLVSSFLCLWLLRRADPSCGETEVILRSSDVEMRPQPDEPKRFTSKLQMSPLAPPSGEGKDEESLCLLRVLKNIK